MMNRPSEEEQLTMVVKNLLPVYHKYFFTQYFPNFKALIAAGTQIRDAINNDTIKNEQDGRDDQESSQDGRLHGLLITLTFPRCEIASQVQDADLGQV